MDAGNSVPGNKEAQKSVVLAAVRGGKKKRDVSSQGQGNDAPVTQERNGNTASLLSLSTASRPPDRVAMTDGFSITSAPPAYPTITTTTTVTSTTTTAPPPRIVLLNQEGAAIPPVWEHYAQCAFLIHNAVFNDACGSELVRQVARVPCTTTFYPVDDAFVDGFIDIVRSTFSSKAGMDELAKEQQSWIDCQAKASTAQQEKLSVWIRLFGYALIVAAELRKEDAQAGLHDPTGKLKKLRNPIDAMRRNLARIHLGDAFGHDSGWLGRPGNASNGPKPYSASHAHRRAGSMTSLFSFSSPESGRKTVPRLPAEDLAAFDSKEKALLAWTAKADKRLEKHQVDSGLLQFFEQSHGDILKDRPDLYCIAYKFVASILFAASTRGIGIDEALVEATESELGYVNEILAFREKLKAVARSDSGAPPEARRCCQRWLQFFQHVSVLMDFRRANRETALRESPEMSKTLASCEIAYNDLARAMKEVDDVRRKQDEDARAGRKSARAKERRVKRRSMDFLMPSKEKRAAQRSGARDTDAIGLATPKKTARKGSGQDDITDEDLPAKMQAGMDKSASKDKQRTRRNPAVAESPPEGELPATSPPTSPRGMSRSRKKPGAFESARQEAGPVRAKEKSRAEPGETRREKESNAYVQRVDEEDTVGQSNRVEKDSKEDGEQKKPGKASKVTKHD